MINKTEIGGVLLAGGKASRMGFRDKALQPLHGKPLLSYGIERAAPQVQRLIVSANHNAELYQPFALTIVPDHDASYRGPLLGIYSAMQWFINEQDDRDIKYLACFAADVPQFPTDVISRLARGLSGTSNEVSYVIHQGQIQPLFSLWKLSLADTVLAAIDSGLFGPKLLFESVPSVALNCDDDEPGSFFNINSSVDLEAASHLIIKK